jgi:Tn3 transposase DDE domain
VITPFGSGDTFLTGTPSRCAIFQQEKVVKFNELVANCVIYSTACDITDAANDITAGGQPVDTDDLAAVSPYITHTALTSRS